MGMLIFSLFGCATVAVPPGPGPQESAPTSPPLSPRPPAPVETDEKNRSPRALASLELCSQGRILIAAKRPDDAIRALERAMNLYPKNGEVYYYLAEAWLQKGDSGQAAEFNRLARIYLQEDPEWIRQIEQQRMKIQNQ